MAESTETTSTETPATETAPAEAAAAAQAQATATPAPETPALHISDEADPNIDLYIDAKLRNYEAARLPEELHGSTRINLYLKDDDGAPRGGVIGTAAYGALFVHLTWIDEACRGAGAGSELYERLEDEARELNCTKVVVSTSTLHDHEFYRGRGYEILGTLKDVPPGEESYWFVKEL